MSGSVTSFAIQNPALGRLVDLLEVVDGHQHNLLRVLTYHRIVEETEDTSFSPGMAVRLPVFQQHMAYLSSRYHILHLQDLLHAVQNGSSLPIRSVLITFDDAYQDFADLAWPVLSRYALPITLFVPTAFPDHPERIFWWECLSQAFQYTQRRDELDTPAGRYPLSSPAQRLGAFKGLRDYLKSLPHEGVGGWVEQLCSQLGVPQRGPRVLDWDALRDLARQGVSLGAHTRTHPLMNRISPSEIRQEIAGSIGDLRREIGMDVPVFAYPGGEISDDAVQTLREMGVELAFTTRRGINDFNRMDRMRISRINIGQRTSLPILRAQLLARSRLFYR